MAYASHCPTCTCSSTGLEYLTGTLGPTGHPEVPGLTPDEVARVRKWLVEPHYNDHATLNGGFRTSPVHNACTDPCDNEDGPCACGAWHKPAPATQFHFHLESVENLEKEIESRLAQTVRAWRERAGGQNDPRTPLG